MCLVHFVVVSFRYLGELVQLTAYSATIRPLPQNHWLTISSAHHFL